MVSVANPSTDTPSLGGFFTNLFGTALGAVQGVAQVKADERIALANASAQAKLNQYKLNDPSVGPNDTAGAQAVANKTLAQTYLPSYMLFQPATDSAGKATGGVKVSPMGWVIFGAVGLLVFLILRRK